MPAHDHRDIDALQRQIVEIGAGEGLRDEARRRGIARRVVEADEIVVDRLRDMDRAQPMIGLLRLLGDDAHRVGGIVAADIEERVDRVRLQDLEDLLAIFEVGLVAGRAERRGRRRRDRLEIGDRLLAEIDEIVVDDAAHALQRAIDMRDVGKPPRLERHAGQRLVDDRRRAAALRDEDLVRHVFSLPFAEHGRPPAPKALGAACVTRKLAEVARCERTAGTCQELPGGDRISSPRRVEPKVERSAPAELWGVHEVRPFCSRRQFAAICRARVLSLCRQAASMWRWYGRPPVGAPSRGAARIRARFWAKAKSKATGSYAATIAGNFRSSSGQRDGGPGCLASCPAVERDGRIFVDISTLKDVSEILWEAIAG